MPPDACALLVTAAAALWAPCLALARGQRRQGRELRRLREEGRRDLAALAIVLSRRAARGPRYYPLAATYAKGGRGEHEILD